jgi:hypothetical protein
MRQAELESNLSLVVWTPCLEMSLNFHLQKTALVSSYSSFSQTCHVEPSFVLCVTVSLVIKTLLHKPLGTFETQSITTKLQWKFHKLRALTFPYSHCMREAVPGRYWWLTFCVSRSRADSARVSWGWINCTYSPLYSCSWSLYSEALISHNTKVLNRAFYETADVFYWHNVIQCSSIKKKT